MHGVCKVPYTSSAALKPESDLPWHDQPDAGGCFAKPETGGWVYASNAEVSGFERATSRP